MLAPLEASSPPLRWKFASLFVTDAVVARITPFWA
jgi:hypothetical protein